MFKFRLQRVLDLRSKTEEDAAVRLADARRGEEEAREAAAELEAARDKGLHRAAGTPGERASIGQLQNLRFLVERLSDGVDQAHRDADAAGKQVSARLEEFSAAFRDRRMLDKLRERSLESWKSTEVQADRQAMDNIALARFVRSRGKTPGKGE